MNPLLMEDFLDGLFKKFTVQDLKICRSVCQLWNNRIVAHLKLFWSDLKIIELYTENVAQNFTVAMFNSKDKKLFTSFDGSVTTISKLGSKFLTEYVPKRLDLSIRLQEVEYTKLEDLINVLKLSSKNLVHLSINGLTKDFVGLTKNEEKKWIDFSFLKLETIKCNILQDLERTTICVHFAQLIKEIIENSPNLKSIENPGKNFSICSSKIISSEMLQKLTKLTKLTINIEVFAYIHNNGVDFKIENCEICQDLLKLQYEGLKLKYLDIKYSVDHLEHYLDMDNEMREIQKRAIENDIKAIEKFLECQSGSLETLKIKIKHDYQMKMYAVFPKLKKLVMGILHSSLKNPLNLSYQFPQLEALFLNIYCKKIVKWNKIFCGSSLKVHTIEICNNGSDGEYRALEILFPYVVNLQFNHPQKNALKYEGFGNFWSKSIKSISIITLQKKFKFLSSFDLKFFKIFNGLQRIDFINQNIVVDSDFEYWKVDFKFLESLENLKFVKLDKLLVNQSDLTELRKKYIVDYIPGNF